MFKGLKNGFGIIGGMTIGMVVLGYVEDAFPEIKKYINR